MRITNRISKKKLLETYKNNYEIVLKRKKELSDKNIELQKKVQAQYIEIEQLKKEKKVLKTKLTKAKKELNNMKVVEIAPSIENGNKIIKEIFIDQEIDKVRRKTINEQ